MFTMCYLGSSFRVSQGEELVSGERFGLIRFGSRVDVYLPLEAKPSVAVGQTAIAGDTTLARVDEQANVPLTRSN